MTRPRLLDLFCGAGGAAVGYHRAGFDVVGVDINPQPRYPFEFHQGDVLDVLCALSGYRFWEIDDSGRNLHLSDFDAIHASPPCQAYTTLRALQDRDYPDLYVQIRERLSTTGMPWVIENVIGAPYRSGFVLCGSMFGLRVRRHRNFETSHLMMPPQCEHRRQGTPLGVYGHGGGGQMTRGVKAKLSQFADLMGMPWATPREIVQAIPPAYTEWIGAQLIQQIGKVATTRAVPVDPVMPLPGPGTAPQH